MLSFLLALTLCMGLVMPAFAGDAYGPEFVGFYVAEKQYSFDEPSFGDGWSYDGNYIMTLSGIQSTYGKSDTGIIYDWIQLDNPKKDFTFVVQEWTLATDEQFTINYSGVSKYADDEESSEYAKPSVYFMTKYGVISGIGNELFELRNTNSKQEAERYANATREQALVMSLRSFKNLQ